MTKKQGQEEVVEDQDQETGGEEQPKKSAAEIAAEEKAAAAERRAAEKEAEAERLKAEMSKSQTKAQPSTYTLSSFSDAEWSDAESSTGLDRKTILANLNLKVQTEGRINSAVGRMEAKLEVQREKEALASEDPLYPKYRKEVDKFLADIPEEFMQTPEGRKKWLSKAFDYGKKSVKITSVARKADNMETKETGKGIERNDEPDFSADEKSVLESHGKTVDDYKKISHPYIKDGIMLKDRPEEPRFGPR